MDVHEIVQQLTHHNAREINALARACDSCRRFIQRLYRTPPEQIGWEDVPSPLLERFSARLHRRLFWY